MDDLKIFNDFAVLKYFKEISMIPRGSGNEKGISDYLVEFAKKLNLEVIQDSALNVIIRKKASKGYENAPTVIIQGHMDMVCEKNSNTNHDFTKDPIKLVVKDDYIYADGTTLGADDGIAIAYGMAILADDSLNHPAIELIVTTDEETGMSGAMALEKKNVTGTVLLNIDTEEEGYLLVSCAGGIRTKTTVELKYADSKKEKSYEIKIRDLKGGHSGMDIHLGRGNANKLLGRVLQNLKKSIDFELVSINGGTKDNAIPRESDAVINVNSSDIDVMKNTIDNIYKNIKNELRITDPNVSIVIEECDKVEEVILNEVKDNIINLLYLYPNGVNTVSADIEGLTESSTNLGIVTTKENKVTFDSAVRSSVPSLKDELVLKNEMISKINNAQFESFASYPGWEYNPDSKIRELCKKVYKEMFNKEAEVYAIHAGVECGLFRERLGNLDMISFGPDIFDAHTPEEHMSISSVERVWKYLLEILKEIKNL